MPEQLTLPRAGWVQDRLGTLWGRTAFGAVTVLLPSEMQRAVAVTPAGAIPFGPPFVDIAGTFRCAHGRSLRYQARFVEGVGETYEQHD